MDGTRIATGADAAAYLLAAAARAGTGPGAAGDRRTALALVGERLDADQRRVLALDPCRPVLITGGAGSGKTTVALHRLAHLHRSDPARHPQDELLVVLPEQALAGLARAALRDLGLSQAEALSVRFGGWDRALAELGAPAYTAIQLHRSHRCPGAVNRFARLVLGPLALAEGLAAAAEGAPVLVSPLDTEAAVGRLIMDGLAGLSLHAPALRIAIIARRPRTAQRVYARLPRSLQARLLLQGELRSGPGIQVTVVSQVQGLEFDVVVIPDAAASEYGDDDGSRRALYVACTRALSQLWVLYAGAPSPILSLAGSDPGPQRGSGPLG